MKSSDSLTPLKIGILQTDSVLAELLPEFGDYPEMFESLLYTAAASRSSMTVLDITTYAVHEDSFPEDALSEDAYLITGSRYSVYDEIPWIAKLAGFLGTVLETDRRVVGICFGHQLLAHFFGGRTQAAGTGWCVGVQETQLLSAEGWMDPPLEEIGLLSSHKDQVAELPENARRIARSGNCPCAGFVLGERVMTLQGHPEFSKAYAARLMRRREELIGEETYARGIQSLEQHTDEAVVGQWILNFMLGEQF